MVVLIHDEFAHNNGDIADVHDYFDIVHADVDTVQVLVAVGLRLPVFVVFGSRNV